MKSIIQKINFLKNENCIFSFFKFWNMDFIFFSFEIRILISIWFSIKIETKFQFMEFDCDIFVNCIMSDLIQWLPLWTMTLQQTKWIFGKWIVEMFQRRQHDYVLIGGCFHKNFEVHVSSFSKQKKLMFKETETFIFWLCTVITQ